MRINMNKKLAFISFCLIVLSSISIVHAKESRRIADGIGIYGSELLALINLEWKSRTILRRNLRASVGVLPNVTGQFELTSGCLSRPCFEMHATAGVFAGWYDSRGIYLGLGSDIQLFRKLHGRVQMIIFNSMSETINDGIFPLVGVIHRY